MSRSMVLIGSTVALGLVVTGAVAEERWNLASILPPGNFQVKNAEAFAAAVAEATDGEVVITVHSGGALGSSGPELLASVRDGLVEMADVQMNQQIGEDLFFGIESLPFLATGYEDLMRLQAITRPYFDEIAEKNNQRILYITPWPPQNVFANVAIVDDVSSFEGVTIRTIDRNATDFFNDLGASAVQMPWGEVVPALSTGAINAVSTSSTSGVDGLFWEFISDMNQLEWQMNSQMVTVNLDAWERLTQEQQAAIKDVTARMQPEFIAVSQSEDAANIETLLSNGMSVNKPSEALLSTLRERSEPYWEAYIGSVGERAQQVIEAYSSAQ